MALDVDGMEREHRRLASYNSDFDFSLLVTGAEEQPTSEWRIRLRPSTQSFDVSLSHLPLQSAISELKCFNALSFLLAAVV
jgi:hypothetical protein